MTADRAYVFTVGQVCLRERDNTKHKRHKARERLGNFFEFPLFSLFSLWVRCVREREREYETQEA